MKKCYKFIFNKFLLLLFVSFNYLSAQNMGSLDDFDGDGIINSMDLDDDNDGILDVNERLNSSTNAIINGNFGTNTASGGNLNNWITNGTGTSNLTNWVAEAGGAIIYMDGAENINLSQTNVPLKSASTPAVTTFTMKVLSVNANGTSPINQGWGKMDVYLETTTGLVRIFRVTNPLTGTLASPTANIELIDPTLVLNLAVNGDYSSRSFATGSYYTITANINTANLKSSGTVLFQRKNGAASGPNGQIGADDFMIDDITYTYNIETDTDNDGILNQFDLDSDGDGCPDAIEGSANFLPNNLQSITTVNPTYTGGNSGSSYTGTSTTPIFANLGSSSNTQGIPLAGQQDIGTSIDKAINTCKDTDGDGIPDDIDIDDDNDGILDAIESNICGSLTSPFTSLEQARATVKADGIYYFNLSGNMFSTYVDANGYVLVAVDYGDGTQALPAISSLGLNKATFGRGILSTATLANLGTIETIRISSNSTSAGGIDATTTNSTLISRIKSNLSLHRGAVDNAINNDWIGTNAGFITTDAPGAAIAADNLNSCILNVAGNTASFNWVSESSNQTIRWATGEIPAADYLALWVRGDTSGAICNVDIDTDNDGIPNRLDLDSDGDGCPDTKEAILYNHSTEASIPGTVKNGSGGTVTSTVNTPNAMVPGPYGNNGFADALQSASNPDAYKYVYTYQFVATDADVSTCDNKFLYDIDSDDDGVPDAVESPSCFYTEAQAMDIIEGVTSDFGWTTTNPLSKTYDDSAVTFGEISAPIATSIQNKALITFDLPVIDAAFINSITLNVGSTNFGGGKWKLQGLDMNTNTWMDLSATAGQSLTAGTIVFNNTLQNNTRYHSYRIIGVDNLNITNAAQLIEFTIQYKNYNASYHRTKMGCNSDADGDGVPNYLDRDTDGDGCPDAVEAGIPLSKLGPANFFNTGGQVAGTHVVVLGNYSNNGMGDDVETTPDSGIINYTSTYTQYANNKTLNFCTDTDGDSVPDLIDIDDDNDGVLDTTECAYPAVPTTTSTNDVFAVWSNTTTAAGTNLTPTYLASVGSWTAGSGLTAAISAGAINLSNVNGNSLADAFGANEYLEHPFTTTADNYNWLYYVRTSTSTTANYHWAMLISDDNFVTYTILNIDMARNGSGAIVNDINDYMLSPSTSYKVRTYFWGSTAFPFDEFTMFGYSECDTDNDGLPNRLDLDSDGDGCPDAVEAGTAAQAGAGNTSTGTLFNTSGTQTGVANAIVGNNTPAAYGANGFYTGIENNDTPSATYIGTYTYAAAINAAISSCFCYKPAATGTALDTNHGITSLQRAGADNSNWPMVRKGAWTALESKTKAFVPNRLTITEINNIPVANLKEGMMVYNISSDCIYINTDGTAAGWKCFNTQTCP
ncbi:hypothetical protein [Chryseobacterium sp. 8AT]|uniref:hypothetical protein n=1 Tax=Chryseobacterium sp. 8AT TaxID=2653134 RepID=UPI0012F110C5|nr:hypothetical protein [Chryseobacterium sp. 8AT]VXB33486.1 conserved exported hypothetical protein [Chryseobacterium sp. 8AT]